MLTNQASPVDLFDASQVRLSEVAVAYDVAMKLGDPVRARSLLLSALDLILGNEQADSSINDLPGVDATIICAYLQETYGLLAVGQDPFLRPLLPPIPVTGAMVRRFVLTINARAIVANTSLIGMGSELVPLVTAAVFGLTYHGAVSSATPLAAEVQALTAETWLLAPRPNIVFNTNGTFPAFAEPQAYGLRTVIKDGNGFDVTSLLTQTSVSYLLSGVATPYYLYVYNVAQYDPALTLSF